MDHCFSHVDFSGIQCIPVVLRKWFTGSNLTSCLTFEENWKSYAKIRQQRRSFQCPLPEFDVEFNAIISDEQFYGVKHQQETITGIFYHSSSFRYLKKELLVHDTQSLVGSLGGFLGLFVGFSFFGAFTFLMNKMCKD